MSCYSVFSIWFDQLKQNHDLKRDNIFLRAIAAERNNNMFNNHIWIKQKMLRKSNETFPSFSMTSKVLEIIKVIIIIMG